MQDDNTTLLSSGSQARAGMSAAMHGTAGSDEREVAATVTQDGGGLDTGASADERLRQELGNANRISKELKEQFARFSARSFGDTPIQSSVVSA